MIYAVNSRSFLRLRAVVSAASISPYSACSLLPQHPRLRHLGLGSSSTVDSSVVQKRWNSSNTTPEGGEEAKENSGSSVEKTKEESAANNAEEDKLRQRAERYAEIRRRNRNFWFGTALVVSGLVGCSLVYRYFKPKKVRLPSVELDERAKYGFASAVACLSKDIPMGKNTEKEASNCGEDAFFIARSAIGVADGVGGWRNKGVDPSLISNQLMKNAQHFVEEDINKQASEGRKFPALRDSAQEILQKAFDKMVKNKEVEAGSTTAVIVGLTIEEFEKKPEEPRTIFFNSANLGDSGFLVIRDGKKIYRSKEQQQPGHFNAPFQLAIYPSLNTSRWGRATQTQYSNTPSQADVATIPAEPGDLIIMGTDGLFDNLYDEQILEIVTKTIGKEATKIDWVPTHQTCKAIANELLNYARLGASNTRWESPFARHAKAAGKFKFAHGGKWDDITIVVSTVQQLANLDGTFTTSPLLSTPPPSPTLPPKKA